MKNKALLFVFCISVLLCTCGVVCAQKMVSNDPANTPYQALIYFAEDVLRWRDVTGNRMSDKFLYGLGGEPMGFHADNKDFGYFLTDLDNDGSDELIFSYYWDNSSGAPESTAEVWDLFTVKDDKIVELGSSIARALYKLCADGQITYTATMSAADGQIVFYRLRGGELELVQNLFFISINWDQNNTKYYLTTQTNEYFTVGTENSLPSDVRELSKSEWEEIRNSCVPAQMELVPFIK